MGSSKRFTFKSNTIIFTIGIVNLKALQRNPTCFQVYGINYSQQTNSSHVKKKVQEMTKVWDL